MSNIHTLSNLGRSSTTKASKDTQIGSTAYHTTSAGSGLLRSVSKSSPSAKLGNVRSLSSISRKLTSAIVAGKDTAVDKHLASLARQKQRVDVPMTPEVRQAACQQREAIRPEAKQTCPNGHKVPVAAAKKQLATNDVYVCGEKGSDGTPCGAMCGGEDVHPLHIEIRFLNSADKHKYVDSVRWLSKNEVDVQTREYIKGHPLVYPHLAEGVLFNDETDAWMGWILGWNIYFWHGSIHNYWDRIRRELESRDGDLDEDDDGTPSSQKLGRGMRKKRKLAVEVEAEAAAAAASEEDGEEEEEGNEEEETAKAIAAVEAAIQSDSKHADKKAKTCGVAPAAAASDTTRTTIDLD